MPAEANRPAPARARRDALASRPARDDDATRARGDIAGAEDVRRMVEGFYQLVLRDDRLADIFLRDAGIDLAEHLPRIRAYWEKLLLGASDYRRHTMNIHRELNAKRALQAADFDRWLALFRQNMDARFAGPVAERAKRLASAIAANMRASLLANGQTLAGG